MPKKSRRIATRQAELSQKKRRDQRHTSFPEPTSATPTDQSEGTPRTEATRRAATPEGSTFTTPRGVPRGAPAPGRRSINADVLPEIKRIGLLTGLVLVILAVLTVLLK